MNKLVSFLSAHNTEIVIFFLILSLVLIVKKVGVGKSLWALLHITMAIFLIVALISTFVRADQMSDPDAAFLKTVGFWGICLVTVCAFWLFLGLTKLKEQVPVILVNAITAVACWLIYELMF